MTNKILKLENGSPIPLENWLEELDREDLEEKEIAWRFGIGFDTRLLVEVSRK